MSSQNRSQEQFIASMFSALIPGTTDEVPAASLVVAVKRILSVRPDLVPAFERSVAAEPSTLEEFRALPDWQAITGLACFAAYGDPLVGERIGYPADLRRTNPLSEQEVDRVRDLLGPVYERGRAYRPVS